MDREGVVGVEISKADKRVTCGRPIYPCDRPVRMACGEENANLHIPYISLAAS